MRHRTAPARTTTTPERRLAARVAAVETGFRETRRRRFVEEMLATGRMTVEERPTMERLYERDAESTVALVSSRPPNPTVAAANAQAAETAEQGRAYAEGAAARFGIDPKEVV